MICFMRPWSATVILLLGCAGAGSLSSRAPETSQASPLRRATKSDTPSWSTTGGSSDGTTCEQAREQYVEEVDLQAGSERDLTASDFGSVLDSGTYLLPCEVPETSKVQICAAVQSGVAVGVTVALEPSAPDVEVCVARQVRALVFPSHPKMDVAVVRF